MSDSNMAFDEDLAISHRGEMGGRLNNSDKAMSDAIWGDVMKYGTLDIRVDWTVVTQSQYRIGREQGT